MSDQPQRKTRPDGTSSVILNKHLTSIIDKIRGQTKSPRSRTQIATELIYLGLEARNQGETNSAQEQDTPKEDKAEEEEEEYIFLTDAEQKLIETLALMRWSLVKASERVKGSLPPINTYCFIELTTLRGAGLESKPQNIVGKPMYHATFTHPIQGEKEKWVEMRWRDMLIRIGKWMAQSETESNPQEEASLEPNPTTTPEF